MDRLLQVLEKLQSLSKEEWSAAIKKSENHVEIRLRGKTSQGAHCEASLGMPAKNYYVTEAIKKLYEGTWDWKFEQFTISEQITRI